MKRRQFGAMLATAAFSLGGVSSVAAETSAQSTEPLQVEDVTVSVGGITSSIGQASFAFQDGKMVFDVSDWTMQGSARSLSIGSARVVASDVSPQTYATIRAAMVDAFSGRSASPLLVALAESNINPDSPVNVYIESVQLDGQPVADQVTATGTAGSVVPEGTQALVQDGASLEEVAALGPSRWSKVTIQRGSAQLTANDVVMQLDGTTLAISSPGGEAAVSGRTFQFSDLTMNVLPPETIPAAHVEFASQVRQLAAEGNLTFSAIRSAAAQSGVNVSNTTEAVRNARFDLSLGQVTEGGEAVVANFSTSGTLAELLQVVQSRL